MKKILVVAECINKNKTSEGIGTSSFLNALAEGDSEIDCVYFEHVQHELIDTSHIDKKINLIKIENNFIDQQIQNFRRARSLSQRFLSVNLLRLRRALKFKRTLKPILENNKYDVVFVRTIAGSIASHKAVLELSKTINFNWVANFNDPAPASLMPYPYFDGKVAFPKLMAKDEALVKEIVSACNGVTSPSVLLTKRFLDFAGIPLTEKKTFAFPHIFVRPDKINTPSFLDKTKFNIVHAGSLLGPRNPVFLLNAFSRFIEMNPDAAQQIKMTFFGSIHQNHKPVFADFLFKDNLEIRDTRIPHADALGVLVESDVLLILEAVADDSPFMPGKLAEFIGLNKTIWSLSPNKSETRRILGPDYSFQCEANDEEAILHQLVEMYGAYKSGKSFELNNARLSKYVSPKYVVEEMNRVINEMQ